jgi:hypothetical protein
LWIGPARVRAGWDLRHGTNAAAIVEVLREHHLERAAVGLLGPDVAAHQPVNSCLPYPGWRAALAELPGVTFRLVGEVSWLPRTACLRRNLLC